VDLILQKHQKGKIILNNNNNNNYFLRKTVLGFVASLNSTYGKYHTECRIQNSEDNINTSLCLCIKRSIYAFIQTSGFPPRKIILFRAGVSDTQTYKKKLISL
jgi:hypothetical protein